MERDFTASSQRTRCFAIRQIGRWMFYKEIIGVKLRHTKHTITQSQQNVNHLLLHLAERTLADRTEMVQLTHTHTPRTLAVKERFSGLGKQL
jgi:hypothetical protein